jgi:hypothetical protein
LSLLKIYMKRIAGVVFAATILTGCAEALKEVKDGEEVESTLENSVEQETVLELSIEERRRNFRTSSLVDKKTLFSDPYVSEEDVAEFASTIEVIDAGTFKVTTEWNIDASSSSKIGGLDVLAYTYNEIGELVRSNFTEYFSLGSVEDFGLIAKLETVCQRDKVGVERVYFACETRSIKNSSEQKTIVKDTFSVGERDVVLMTAESFTDKIENEETTSIPYNEDYYGTITNEYSRGLAQITLNGIDTKRLSVHYKPEFNRFLGESNNTEPYFSKESVESSEITSKEVVFEKINKATFKLTLDFTKSSVDLYPYIYGYHFPVTRGGYLWRGKNGFNGLANTRGTPSNDFDNPYAQGSAINLVPNKDDLVPGRVEIVCQKSNTDYVGTTVKMYRAWNPYLSQKKKDFYEEWEGVKGSDYYKSLGVEDIERDGIETYNEISAFDKETHATIVQFSCETRHLTPENVKYNKIFENVFEVRPGNPVKLRAGGECGEIKDVVIDTLKGISFGPYDMQGVGNYGNGEPDYCQD